MLQLNAKQIEFLVNVQAKNDWAANAFPWVVCNHQEEFSGSAEEYTHLIDTLVNLSIEQIANLQTALNIFESLGFQELPCNL